LSKRGSGRCREGRYANRNVDTATIANSLLDVLLNTKAAYSGAAMADRGSIQEYYLKLKLKDSAGYRHIGRTVRRGPIAPGCELPFTYSGREGLAIVRGIQSPMASHPDLVALPVIHADEL